MSSDEKNIKKTATNDTNPTPVAQEDESQDLVKNLYEKNIETVNKNKTLSLLSKLYEISVQTLSPKELAARISTTIQSDLSFETVGIYMFESQTDTLTPLAFSSSERMAATLSKINTTPETINIPNIKSHKFLSPVLYERKDNFTNNIEDFWGGLISASVLDTLATDSHIKAIIVRPLLVENKVLGIVMIALNREYEVLSPFEKESIQSFGNVIALTLEKAYLYTELEDANAKLKELDQQKDELLGIVSHQLATPVTAIQWNLEMMMDGDNGKLPKEQEDNIKSLQGVAANLSDLVSMILDVSRIQLGRMKLDKQELDLKSFFNEILTIIEPKAKERNVNLEVSIPSEFPKAMLDKRYTHMTIENLLSNAVKYTPEKGNVSFKVEIKNDTLFCEVKDTGVGIPKADQDKIFGKMFRASNVRNTVDGNGFGLYVAKGAIESQGGKIWFKSEEGKGTTFFIELPLNGEK